ncbi:FIST C-terminal domain-containing protein [Luteimonas sp. SJ-92]|uniref:FIST C-terminal domain-containing protein n=1 Tax=Luteimonas salinisoli TaxID=2752307 RepID=A0A853J7B7_9GAMM|nr:FIST N-terminal domain-containing protein [Luteimonas salinisoli]NZA24963.1 FIST C-terminal domain-containing protein [Luteimonas salinisoli]
MALSVTHAETSSRNAAAAVRDLAAQLGDAALDAVLLFCDPDYDLDALGPAIKAAFACPVLGCTSAGQLGARGFQASGILAAGVRGGAIDVHPLLIAPLSDLQAQAAVAAATVQAMTESRPAQWFALLLVDGLSTCEEHLAAALYQMTGNIPLIGGSAGDNLKFERTHVYHDGRFLSDAAVLALFECRSPFAIFKFQHFVPSEVELVVTGADPDTRTILELDGEPAALAYAEAVGVAVADLDAAVFSTHPLLLTIAGEPYVRSILRANDDLSLTCYCAVDEAMVVSVGRAVDAMQTLEHAFAEVRRSVPDPALVIGCDCILRRVGFEQSGMDGRVGAFMAAQNVFGFSTYGEQFNGLHVNQTFTGVAIGA